MKNIEIEKMNLSERIYIANNYTTPSEVLTELAKDNNYDVRYYVAENPATPSEVLTELAKDSDFMIRSFVAKNPATLSEVLTELAKDSDYTVRYSVARNPYTPSEVLAELAKDSDYDVRYFVAGNPATPSEVLTELAKGSEHNVRYSVAGNPATPSEVLTELAKDSDYNVRCSSISTIASLNNSAIVNDISSTDDLPFPAYLLKSESFVVSDKFVAVKGTFHIWYKHHHPNSNPFYTCGCFHGFRKQLLSRIYSEKGSNFPLRIKILEALDRKYQEVFGE